MADQKRPGRPVRGQVEDATEEGFARLILRAGDLHAEGLVLVGVVAIGAKKLGGVYVHMPKPAAPMLPSATLIGE